MTRLFNEKDGVDDVNILLEQYKLYLSQTENISNKRTNLDTIYTGFNTLILSVASPFFQNVELSYQGIIITTLVGIMICLTWILKILSYKQLVKLKFIVISEMEAKLFARPYSYEWELLKEKNYKYNRLNQVQMYIPVIFIILYVTFFLLGFFV